MVAQLAERMKSEPDNVDGWRMLARSYANLQRFDEAAELFGMARSLYPDDATLAYNEAVFTEQFSKKQIEDKWTRVQQLTQPPVAE